MVEHCRDIVRLGVAGIRSGWILQEIFGGWGPLNIAGII